MYFWLLWLLEREVKKDDDKFDLCFYMSPCKEGWIDKHPNLSLVLAILFAIVLFSFAVYIGVCMGRSTWTPWISNY